MLRFLAETFLLGLKNLRLHKLRSLLTALGIILGVLAVIVMVAIGEGAKRAALEQMEQLGANNIVVRSVKPSESNDASEKTQRVLQYGLKREDAARLGASDFALTSKADTFAGFARRFDFILDTVSAAHDYSAYLDLLKTDGTMILVGAPDESTPLGAFPLILRRRRLVGSLIGGIKETQEMLDFCAQHQVASDVEVISIQQVNEAYERMMRGDVRYRFVIDLNTLT